MFSTKLIIIYVIYVKLFLFGLSLHHTYFILIIVMLVDCNYCYVGFRKLCEMYNGSL